MDSLPKLSSYLRINLPKNKTEKIKELEKYIDRIIICNVNPKMKEHWISGLLYRTEKLNKFGIKYIERKKIYSRLIDIGNLEELLVKKYYV